MPFMHSESLADQLWSLAFFQTLDNADSLDSARQHLAMILRFGRFPHRNRMLGRGRPAG